jgi:hypothetical protein
MGRTELPRFQVGDTVKIRSTISTRHAGAIGSVTKIQSSRHSGTLDKYTVQFDPSLEAEFWEFQLERVGN